MDAKKYPAIAKILADKVVANELTPNLADEFVEKGLNLLNYVEKAEPKKELKLVWQRAFKAVNQAVGALQALQEATHDSGGWD